MPKKLTIRSSFSRLKSWRSCKKKHDYAYNQLLRKKAPPVPLFRGNFIHEMIENQINHGDYSKVIKKYKKQFGSFFIEEREIYGDLIPESIRIVEGYFERWGENGGLKYYTDKATGKKAEIKLEIDLAPGILFVAKVDAMPETKMGIWAADHKTHKNIPDEESRFSDIQLVTYCSMLPKAGHPKPVGVMWDYLRTKAPTIPEVLKSGELSKAKKIDTTPEVFLKAIKDHDLDPKDYKDILASLEKSSKNKFFERVWLPHPSKSLVSQIDHEILDTSKQILEFGTKIKDRNMGRDCKQCSYYNLCHAELRGLDSKFIREKHYEVRDADQEEAEEQGGPE